jgi:polysaccharide export outer membrane protein
LGEVPVAGLATVEAERRIAKALESGGFVKKPQVNVLVTSFQSQQVSVLGLVNRPGRYPMDSRRTLIDVLALAGGISAEGGDTAVLIRTRDGKTTKDSIDLPMMMRSADLSQNLDLIGGDVIYIERAPKFYIYGEVQRPGVYRLERNMTVIQALSAGGGLNIRGTERGMRVKRLGVNGEIEEVRVRHGDILRPDDVLYVQESLF